MIESIIIDWQFKSADKNHIEEERHLYYVTMTCAIDHLVLMQYKNTSNPHIACLDSEFCRMHYSSQSDEQVKDLVSFYTTGLSHLYLSYAEKFQPDHLVNQTLEKLLVGDKVTACSR